MTLMGAKSWKRYMFGGRKAFPEKPYPSDPREVTATSTKGDP